MSHRTRTRTYFFAGKLSIAYEAGWDAGYAGQRAANSFGSTYRETSAYLDGYAKGSTDRDAANARAERLTGCC